jgi:hypothetical protein
MERFGAAFAKVTWNSVATRIADGAALMALI